MKQKEIYDEMIDLLKSLGYKIRKENGNFEGGACILRDEKIIILNKTLPIELHLSILSNVISEYSDKIFIRPKIREFIEKQIERSNLKPIEIVVKGTGENDGSKSHT